MHSTRKKELGNNMLNKTIEFSIKNKLIIGLFTLGLILYGAFQVTQLPIDAVPDITDNQVQVITVSPSLGAPDVERLVTFPVEQANSNIPGIKDIRSFSRFGLSVVTLVFDENTDVYWARQQVSERLQEINNNIPTGVGTPELGPVTTGLGEIYQYVIRPTKGFEGKYNAMELRTIQDWYVRRQLLGVKGVADVSSFGGLLKQYEIAVDAHKLKATGVTINEVFDALAKNNQNTGGGYIEKGPNLYFIRSEGLITNENDLSLIPVKNNPSGLPILIRDVGKIQTGAATRYGTMYYNDEMEVAGAVVMMLKGANSNLVIENVKERIAKIQKTLPKGVVIEPFLDRTKMVNNAIGTVKTNLLEGALIVLFVLMLFLGNFRAGIIVASVIPLAMLFAIIMMNWFGVSGNLMSLGALDFGLIIDGAVIIVEAVLHFLNHSKTLNKTTDLLPKEMDGIVHKTTSRMMNSAVFGQIVILVVYLPIFALSGIEGKMFKPMAQTVTFALIGAFILSLTYVPMMSALFLSKKTNHKKNFSDKMMEFIEIKYQFMLELLLNKKKWVIGISLGLMVVSFFILSHMGGEFIPKLEEGDFAVETRILTGSNLSMSIDVSKKASKILMRNFPEVERVVSKIGSGEIPTDPMPIEAQDLMIILKDKSQWTSADNFDELAEKMSAKLSEIPGVSFGFQFPVQMRFNELMTGARQDIVCKIFGENLDSLAYYAKQLGAISETVKGATDLFVEPVGGLPQIVIKYNRPVISQYGISIEEINNIVQTAFAGKVAGKVFEGEKRFDLVVRLENENRNSLADVQGLLVPLKSGDQIPLEQLAKVEIEDGPNQIQREDAKRRIIVGLNARGRDVQSIVEELRTKTEKAMQLPVGYYVTYGGAFENLQAAKKRLGIAVPVSMLLIFLLLYFAFGSVKDGLLIYSAIPLSAIGGVLALVSRGLPFSISAGVGFIALFGVAVLNGIVLISEFNRLRSEGWSDIRKVVIHGTKIRLRPVLMTAAVASLGFLPMALSNGAGAEVQRPLATVVIGGLVTATFLTLFVLPILYILFNKTKIQMNSTVKIMLIIALFSFSKMQLSAQQSIDLNRAIDSALVNNLSLKNEYLNVKYFEALQKTAFDPDATVFESEYGQFNSVYRDTRFTLSQSLSFPVIYNRQKSRLETQLQIAEAQAKYQSSELKREVEKKYYAITYLQQKEDILNRADSIYSILLYAAELKLKIGESNVIERDFVKMQRFGSGMQLKQVVLQKEILISQFKLLMNTQLAYIPENQFLFSIPIPSFSDTQFIQSHPAVMLALNQLKSAVQIKKLEETRYIPKVNIGYNNMSIQGFGGDNRNYTSGYRFQSVQISVGVPLFRQSICAKNKALNLETRKAENTVEYAKKDLAQRWEKCWLEYENALFTMNWYRDTGMVAADRITHAARLQYISGEIDYLQFATLFNQTLTIQSAKAESEYNYNQSLIELNALTNP